MYEKCRFSSLLENRLIKLVPIDLGTKEQTPREKTQTNKPCREGKLLWEEEEEDI